MFKSIQYIKHLGYDPKIKFYFSLFKIADKNFEEEVEGACLCSASGIVMGSAAETGAVISFYSKRNLNVPKNLLLLFQYYEKEYGSKYYSIEQQISLCDKHQPLFLKYKEDVEKYLLLL